MVRGEPHVVVVGLGSNLGDRVFHLRSAVQAMEEAGLRMTAFSSVVETPPVGYLDQPPFLNLVVRASTDLPPRQVLAIFHSVERMAGRVSLFRNGPRTLDLDLLFFDQRIIRYPELRVPHPRWKGRSFVVMPLLEVAPGLRDPETGCSVEEVASRWPLEPEEIRTVLSSEEFQRTVKEWNP